MKKIRTSYFEKYFSGVNTSLDSRISFYCNIIQLRAKRRNMDDDNDLVDRSVNVYLDIS